jgi:hypothetical protein
MTRGLSRRASSFCFWFVETGGKGASAARQAGYKGAAAANMATYLLRHAGALELIAAQIRRRAPGHEAALRRLMRPSRPEASRRRLAVLLCRDLQPGGYLEAPPGEDFPKNPRNSAHGSLIEN